jgi:hypothetical protein
MRTQRRDEGYALLAALVITTLAAAFAATAVASVAADHRVAAADRAGSRADAAAWEALDGRAERLRWQPWQAQPPLSLTGWPTVAVQSRGEARGSLTVLDAVFELRLPPWCGGLVTGGDAELGAPVTVANSGAYIGGSLRGREQVAFTPAPPGGPPGAVDLVHGDEWPLSAVHALGGVWAAGVEIHDPDGSGSPGDVDPAYAADTDTHTGAGDILAVTQGPGTGLLAALSEGSAPPGLALADGLLDVSLLPDEPSTGGAADPGVTAVGYVVVVPTADTPVRIVGRRAVDACPLVLVVLGDATAGEGAAPLSLRGALAVCGRLDVMGATTVDGSLFAGSLVVAAPLAVVTSPDWRAHPLAGLATPVIVALARR